jgi:hypothetical protein
MCVLDLLRLKPVTRFASASTRFGFRYPEFVSLIPSANPLFFLPKPTVILQQAFYI